MGWRAGAKIVRKIRHPGCALNAYRERFAHFDMIDALVQTAYIVRPCRIVGCHSERRNRYLVYKLRYAGKPERHTSSDLDRRLRCVGDRAAKT